jgi:hypothetical protein
MRTEMNWEAVTERLEAVRNEAATHRLLKQATRVNLWARLLPTLRRLEAWMERHAGSEGQRQTLASR